MNNTTRRTGLAISLVLFAAALLVSWLTQGTGIVRNDLARNIYIPDDLTMPLQVKAAYNGRNMFFRYRWCVITLLLIGLGLWGRRASASA